MSILTPTWDEMKQATRDAFEAPARGDLFHEMYSFWVAVLHAEGNVITYVTKTGGLRAAGAYELFASPVADFRRRFSYGDTELGYWVLLSKRGADVEPFAEAVAS